MKQQQNSLKGETDTEIDSVGSSQLLLEEYKIIQGKIDKLGEDKFKVRSWSFTLLTGGVAVAKFSGTLENSSLGPYLLLLFLPAVAAFHLVELRQRQIGKRLGLRAEAIEFIWRRSSRSENGSYEPTPQLARHMIREGRSEKARSRRFYWWKNNFEPNDEFAERERKEKKHFRAAPHRSSEGRSQSRWEWLVVNAEDAFYGMQYFLIVIFVAVLVWQRISQSSEPPQPATTLVLRLNTNEFRLFVGQTNITITNFLEVVRITTNFQVVNQLTTNYVPTNILIPKPVRP